MAFAISNSTILPEKQSHCGIYSCQEYEIIKSNENDSMAKRNTSNTPFHFM